MIILKKYKHILFTLLVVGLFLGASQSVLAATEINYPPLLGAPTITSGSSLTDFIQYFFALAVAVAGLIGVVSIVIAGISILINASNPSAVGAAKERIFSSILGIILLMVSFIILRTINTSFITPKTVPGTLQGTTAGLYLVGDAPGGVSVDYPDGKIYETAPRAVPDTNEIEEFTKLFYYCPPNSTSERTALVWTYDQYGYGLNSEDPTGGAADTRALECGTTMDITDTTLSLNWAFQEAGVYFYLNSGCEGISTPVQKSSGNIAPFSIAVSSQGYQEEVLSMKIVSDSDIQSRYGVVLNKSYLREGDISGGECGKPIVKVEPGAECFDIPVDLAGQTFYPLSAYIFNVNPFFGTSGTGVWLYNDEKELLLTSDLISNMFFYGRDPDELISTDPNSIPTAPILGGTPCTVGNTCLNAINFNNGNYNVFLYGRNGNDIKCELFNQDLTRDDIQSPGHILDQGKRLYSIGVIPFPPN